MATSELRFAAYVEGLVEVIGHADRAVPLQDFWLGALLRTIARKKPTIFHGVPTIHTAINNSPLTARYDLSSIKSGISGGAPLPVDVKASFEKLTGCILVEATSSARPRRWSMP